MTNKIPITKKIKNQRDTEIRFLCQLAIDNGYKPKEIYRKLSIISGLSEEYIRQLFYEKINANYKAVVNS